MHDVHLILCTRVYLVYDVSCARVVCRPGTPTRTSAVARAAVCSAECAGRGGATRNTGFFPTQGAWALPLAALDAGFPVIPNSRSLTSGLEAVSDQGVCLICCISIPKLTYLAYSIQNFSDFASLSPRLVAATRPRGGPSFPLLGEAPVELRTSRAHSSPAHALMSHVLTVEVMLR